MRQKKPRVSSFQRLSGSHPSTACELTSSPIPASTIRPPRLTIPFGVCRRTKPLAAEPMEIRGKEGTVSRKKKHTLRRGGCRPHRTRTTAHPSKVGITWISESRHQGSENKAWVPLTATGYRPPDAGRGTCTSSSDPPVRLPAPKTQASGFLQRPPHCCPVSTRAQRTETRKVKRKSLGRHLTSFQLGTVSISSSFAA